MNPYLLAHAAYQSQQPDIPWCAALDFHLQHGMVISTPTHFVMARPVRLADGDHEHLALSVPADPAEADALHIWMAAGDMKAMRKELRRFPWVKGITFVRKDSRVRRWPSVGKGSWFRRQAGGLCIDQDVMGE